MSITDTFSGNNVFNARFKRQKHLMLLEAALTKPRNNIAGF
jgi:hypothetical protein